MTSISANHAAIDSGTNSVHLHVAEVGQFLELLEAAGLLHNAGLFVSHAAHHQHSECIVGSCGQLTGCTAPEADIVAQAARYQPRSAPKKSHQRFVALAKTEQKRVRWLAGILRTAIALDRTRNSIVESVSIESGADTMRRRPRGCWPGRHGRSVRRQRPFGSARINHEPKCDHRLGKSKQR
jgi:exopolyphosphatase/pppGpp-phosphohydrolase